MTKRDAPTTEDFRLAVLSRIDRYRAMVKISDSTISRRAVGDSDFVVRLRRGENVTLAKVARLEQWLKGAEDDLRRGVGKHSELPAVVSPCA